LGSHQGKTRADSVENLLRFDWGGPPHCIVLPGRLHFMEVEALEILCGARREILEGLI
jgi:diphthamide biosynthesis methyltransferase